MRLPHRNQILPAHDIGRIARLSRLVVSMLDGCEPLALGNDGFPAREGEGVRAEDAALAGKPFGGSITFRQRRRTRCSLRHGAREMAVMGIGAGRNAGGSAPTFEAGRGADEVCSGPPRWQAMRSRLRR